MWQEGPLDCVAGEGTNFVDSDNAAADGDGGHSDWNIMCFPLDEEVVGHADSFAADSVPCFDNVVASASGSSSFDLSFGSNFDFCVFIPRTIT